MKFSEYIKEYIDSPASKEYENMFGGLIPVTPSMMKDLTIRIPVVYRVAGAASPSTEKRYEGKKKVFSGFTKGSSGIARGAISGGTYLYEKSADVLVNLKFDAGTRLDRNGNKWLNFFDGEGLEYKAKMFDKMKDYVKKIDPKSESLEEFILFKATQNQKKDFIKWYFDESKKILTKKFMDKLLKDYNKKANNIITWNNNELLYTNYTIKGAYIIVHEPLDLYTTDDVFYDKLETLKKNKIKYLGNIYYKQIKDIDEPYTTAKSLSKVFK
jgi:predicted RNA-binding protein